MSMMTFVSLYNSGGITVAKSHHCYIRYKWNEDVDDQGRWWVDRNMMNIGYIKGKVSARGWGERKKGQGKKRCCLMWRVCPKDLTNNRKGKFPRQGKSEIPSRILCLQMTHIHFPSMRSGSECASSFVLFPCFSCLRMMHIHFPSMWSGGECDCQLRLQTMSAPTDIHPVSAARAGSWRQ
jgi:hypothetical protein